jgi:hypothetical protein
VVVSDAFEMTSVAVPVFVTVSSCAPLILVTSTSPNGSVGGALICGAVPRPVTGILTVISSGSLLAIVMSVFAAPGAVGSNVIVSWAVAPGATVQLVVQLSE